LGKNAKLGKTRLKVVYIKMKIDKEEALTPQEKDQTSVSGSEPVPDSDSNVLDNAHDVGLYSEADEENPKEVGIGREIEEDEKRLVNELPENEETKDK
jgi:hypothetical protein